MEKLQIAPTKYTPEICFDSKARLLIVKGRSYPENTADFYQPVMQWLQTFLDQKPVGEIIVNIELSYFNSSSSKILMDMMDLFDDKVKQKNLPITVNWFYDEEDEIIFEHGEEFKEDLTHLTFNLVAKTTNN